MSRPLNTVVYLQSKIDTKSLPEAGETIDSITIEGYANTTTVDRARDIIPKNAWDTALENYLKNPIVLAYHNHNQPVGKVTEHKVTDNGLWIKARISAAAEEVFNLVKDGVITAFSIGFVIKDAVYDAVTDLFIIKELELLEISVVSVPMNQNSLFSVSKSHSDPEAFMEFKKQFMTSKSLFAKEQEKDIEVNLSKTKGKFMDPKDLEKLVSDAAIKGAEKAAEAFAARQKEAEDKLLLEKKQADEAAALDALVAKQVSSSIEVMKSGAEKLLEDITKRVQEAEEGQKNILAGLENTIKEKAAELAAIQSSKMSFSDKTEKDSPVSIQEKESAFFVSKILGTKMADTKLGRQLVEKLGPHQPSGSDRWETEVSLNLENDIRRRLVVAPLLRNINMNTNVMKVPVNPDAGIATWVQNTEFGTNSSSGATGLHQLQEITLSSYKVATREYMNFEEEEDSLIALAPIIRDAMVRRVSRAVDRAFLRGAGAGGDPVKGLATYDTTSVVVPTVTGLVTMAHMRALRKDLGIWGLDPAEFAYIVSQDVYYDLMEDTSFQSVLQVGMENATLLTGQVGMIGSTPVVISGEFPTKAGGAATAATNIGAIAVARGNWIVGNQRGLRLDMEDLVEKQQKVMVASLRTGLVNISADQGQGVSALRFS